ncbi:GspH/FimT family pseudopilin [Salinimonas iocasae]|uniref:Type II secretion system protein H n=1 Tax=Salinimonas iocasae TaxID=2572577 RepID=A0A5B7YCN0_9ALTE|nr:GspH/FimT family pseudopilin [Salinimonas iocasae]QCZ93016.1 prepilin-type N-terminal cleavage/methylation domain-containing protein [Salinimonas iocasae]
MVRKSRFEYKSGFSLIELLISIAIVAILLINAPPSYINWYQQTKLKNAAGELSLLLHQAQRQAVTQNRPIFVMLNGPHSARVIVTTDIECIIQEVCSPAQISKQLRIDKPVKVESKSFSRSYIRFAPSTGLPDGMAGSLVMRTNDFRIKLIVSRLGRIRTCVAGKSIAGVPLC